MVNRQKKRVPDLYIGCPYLIIECVGPDFFGICWIRLEWDQELNIYVAQHIFSVLNTTRHSATRRYVARHSVTRLFVTPPLVSYTEFWTAHKYCVLFYANSDLMKTLIQMKFWTSMLTYHNLVAAYNLWYYHWSDILLVYK